MKTISERLGHSSASFTMDKYGYLLPGTQEEVARRLNQKLREAFEGQE